jgi:hypothetical protein
LSVVSSTFIEGRLRAHIAYGPYGSGKSYIASIISAILGNRLSKSDQNLFVKKFSKINDNVNKVISDFNKYGKKYIPIHLTGFEGEFEDAIYREVNKKLSLLEIEISTDDIYNQIIDIITLWETEYKDTYIMFKKLLISKDIEVSEFVEEIKKRSDLFVPLFKELYKEITSGIEFEVKRKNTLVGYLENVLIQLKGYDLGLLIIYDEFGRFLQNLDTTSVNRFMGEFQDLAELANNGAQNLSVVFITHKPIAHYFSYESIENRSEFAKVEKRFHTHEIKSDYNTFLSITEGFIDSLKNRNITKADLKYHSYNVFAGILSDKEVEELHSRFYPLHPVSLYLLPKISSVFGQNERTLFTFLNDNTSFGLSGHNNDSDQYYYPDLLIDYFFTNIDETYVEDNKEYHIYSKKINEIYKTKNKNKNNAIRVFKFALLWKISHNDSDIKLVNKFIVYSLGLKEKEVDEAVLVLIRLKVLRFNALSNEYEIFEGSSLDIPKEIKKLRASLILSDSDIYTKLTELNNYRYVYSESHNAKFEITRFAELVFVGSNKTVISYSDDVIEVYLNEQYITEKSGNLRIIVIGDYEKLKDIIANIVVLQRMIKTPYYHATYPNVNNEFEYELSLNIQKLYDFFDTIFTTKSKFYDGNNQLKISTKSDLERYLSSKYDEKYYKSIHVVNDQVNMYNITKIQQNAMISVLDKVLNNSRDQNDAFYTGSKPADLIYFTLVKNIQELNNNKLYLEDLKNDLSQYLKNNTSEYLYNVFKIALNPPYGLRPHVAIIIVFSLIKDYWNDIMLFSNGNFIPSIDTEELYDNILNNKNIKYSFNIFDNEHKQYLEELEQLFDDVSEQVLGKSTTVRVCSGMYKWYLDLPVITQQLTDMNLSDMSFLKTIASSRIDPKKAILDMMEQFTPEEVMQFKESVEYHFVKYLENLRQKIFRRLGIRDVRSWAESQSLISQKNNLFVNSILNDDDFISVYSKNIENISIEKWTRSSFDKLVDTIVNDVRTLSSDTKYYSVIINGKEKHVQDVDLSRKAETALENIENLLEATSRYYSEMELEQIVIKLIERYIK